MWTSGNVLSSVMARASSRDLQSWASNALEIDTSVWFDEALSCWTRHERKAASTQLCLSVHLVGLGVTRNYISLCFVFFLLE